MNSCGPQNLKNDTIVSSLGLLLSPILDAVLERTVSWKLQQAEKEGKSRKEGKGGGRGGEGREGERGEDLLSGHTTRKEEAKQRHSGETHS